MDKELRATKVVQRNGSPWGVVQVHEMDDQVMLVICSEAGTLLAQPMSNDGLLGDMAYCPFAADRAHGHWPRVLLHPLEENLVDESLHLRIGHEPKATTTLEPA